MTITLSPNVLQWARNRAALDEDGLAKKVGVKRERIVEWEQNGQLTLHQAEKVAHVTHTPMGFLFLPEPADDSLPIRDLRTVGDAGVTKPSPDLLETVQLMQSRQAWMEEFLTQEGEPPNDYVGTANMQTPPHELAMRIRDRLGLRDSWARAVDTWSEALYLLRQRADEAEMLVVISGVVGNNTRRVLKTDEFRGFALCSRWAPLIFINGTDSKSAQMFTFAHELAHLWIGADGVSNLIGLLPTPNDVETYCNSVAAEFLIPSGELRATWGEASSRDDPYGYLARVFKVSPVVAARRTLDLGYITREAFFNFYEHYRSEERRQRSERQSGGDFWNNQNVRIGNRFGAAVVRATKEGRLLFRDAYKLTGLSGATFDQYATNLGFRI